MSNPTASREAQHEICRRIVIELRRISEAPSVKWLHKGKLPNILGGRAVSAEIASDIESFAEVWFADQAELLNSMSARDKGAIAREAFGSCIWRAAITVSVEDGSSLLLDEVDELLKSQIDNLRKIFTFHYGCWLVRGSRTVFTVGPVTIQQREQWLAEQVAANRIDEVAARRISRLWNGEKLRKRKSSLSSSNEGFVLSAIGECEWVCSVNIRNMAPDMAATKAKILGRLSLVVISLLWENPARAFQGFGLAIDGGWRVAENLAHVNGSKQLTYSSRSIKMPGVTIAKDDLAKFWMRAEWIRTPCARALSAFASAQLTKGRSNAERAVFLAMWWMHEAMTAESDLMATVKYGAVLDVLSGGSGNKGKIQMTIANRLGLAMVGPVLEDGKTLRQIVEEIYGIGRSSTLHGLNDKTGVDWSDTRKLAAYLASETFKETLSSMQADVERIAFIPNDQ